MKRVFITYGDASFEKTKKRIVQEAESVGVFDEVIAYGPENVSPKVLSSETFKIQRGGGLWCWKPDVILSTLEAHDDGDIIVYCDAGCSLYRSSEWSRYFKHLTDCDILAQRLLQRTDRWTTTELMSFFSDNGPRWTKDYQYLSGVIFFRNSQFCRKFVEEWRDIMLAYPEWLIDVPIDKRHLQPPSFIESRHDQSVFSALIYKYLLDPQTRHLIYTQWEHVEFFDVLRKQAIRATRFRHGEKETLQMKLIALRRRFAIDFILKPFCGVPLHWWYSR